MEYKLLSNSMGAPKERNQWFMTDPNRNSGAARLYRSNEKWSGNVMNMFLELRRLVSGYPTLAIKYNPKYKQILERIQGGC